MTGRAIPALCALALVFLAGFLVQRGRSDALATLRLRGEIESAARAAHVDPGTAMALCHERGGRLARAEIDAALREYLELLARLRSPMLALCAFAGEGSAVDECLAKAGGDADKAAALLLRRPEGIAAVRLQSMAKRLPQLPGG